MNNSRRKNVFMGFLAILFSLAFCMVLGEAIIRVYLSDNIIYDIEMTRYSTSLKDDSDNPLIGHLHKPNAHSRLMGVDVRINSDGFRDKEYPISKSDKYRIIFLGDSLTFGWGLEKEKTFEHILEKRLNKVYPAEIINFGTGNYNTEQEVNLFFEKGLKYKPDKVVLFYFINDAETTPKKSRFWFLEYSRIITFYWSRINAFINNIVPSKSFKDYYAGLYREDRKGWINAKKAFLQLKAVCQKENITLQVVLLPELHELKEYPFTREHETVSAFLRDNDIPFIDLTPFFANYENPMELWVAYDDAHPNELAHQLIADYSFKFIQDVY